MSVSGVSSSSSADSSLLSSLGVSTGAGDAIDTDLQSYEQAKSTGDSSTADAAIVQLKSDLAAEQAQLLAGLEGSAQTDESDTGNNLLSGLLTLNSNSDISSALEGIQNLSAQNAAATAAQAATATTTGSDTEDADALGTTGTKVNVSA